MNRVIRQISETLVEADTREDIERIVCEQLAASDPYQFAWIGSEDVETETITPQAWAGVSNEYFENHTISTKEDEPSGQGPVSTALRTRTVQIVQDTVIDQSLEPWRETIHQHGFAACISIPLTHAELSYGVLTLYADTPNVFDEMEAEVLAELGEMIAHSIDAAETKELLRAPSVVELTFTVSDTTDILARLARAIGDEIHFDGLVDHSEDGAELYFTVQDSTADDVVSATDGFCGISEIQVISDKDEERVFTVTVTEPTLASRIIDNQAIIRSLTTTEQEMTVVVDLPSTTAVREFLDALKSTYPNLGLVARQNNDRPIKRGQGLQEVVTEQLTDRQREVLKTAYLSGFFQSPRGRTGAELAEALDISQSTFTHHLRGAERRFFEMVFDND
ncbi:bacterio-opsin activator domain-containing protein [Halocatena marina]|uniref:bacterio-opsin activator domain-containing protein n=1 Tax=Halocatena marina TaxID=2934937 RepID=UPI0036145A81